MALSLSIHDVRLLDPGLWKARLPPAELHFLGDAATRLGELSVVLVSETPAYDKVNRSLTFNPSAARVLNIGSTEAAVIVQSSSEASVGVLPAIAHAAGDATFLAALPSSLKDLGTQLLAAVRSQYPGQLKFFPQSSKYVETPDNFWTVRIQGRDGSFRITVRGNPQEFSGGGSLQVKPDMTGYSSFKVSSPSQLNDFLSLLRQVPRKGRRA